MTLVADVAGTAAANDTYWAGKCTSIPSAALFLVLKMGDVLDFFKPADASTSYCDMLQARNKHQWSPNGVDWFAIEFYDPSNDNGGSAQWWPRDKGLEGDARMYLSFWGHDSAGYLGGCCSTSTAAATTGDWWGQSFTLSYALPLQPLPPNMGMSLVAEVDGTTHANNAFWAEHCKSIPPDALFVVLDMGTIRDFFRPPESSTYCEMLLSEKNEVHQWSADGTEWVAVAPSHHDQNGGSGGSLWSKSTPVSSDQRDYLSFWGVDEGGTTTGGCCSSSYTEQRTYHPPKPYGWGQSFTLYYTLPLQLLPPNMGMSLVAEVAGTTIANDAFWAEHCKSIPPSTLFLVLDMGAVRDFFKPADAATSYCDMLEAHTKHQWSPNGVDWFAIEFYDSIRHNGGSAANWPRDNGQEGDERAFFSFWGDDRGSPGGCCSTSTAESRTDWDDFRIPFTLSYALPQFQPLPPNIGMSLVANVPGTTHANDAFWAEQCKSIPPSTLFLVLDMGAVRDFFKPTEGSTYCEMLQAINKHQWSPNGVDWFAVEFDNDRHNGGSASWWPRDKGMEGDVRIVLSFWGSYLWIGGCCSSSTAVENTGGWKQSFTLSYALPLQPLPPNMGVLLVANVPGTTIANDAFWTEQCKSIPPDTLFVVLDMGTVRDFFKPVESTTSFCVMLQAYDKHQWSPNGVDWFAVEFHNHSNYKIINGGSAYWWPRDKGREGDVRQVLSRWGKDSTDTGGCCSSSIGLGTAKVDGYDKTGSWGHSFTLSYAVSTATSTSTSITTTTTTTTTTGTTKFAAEAVEDLATNLINDETTIATTPLEGSGQNTSSSGGSGRGGTAAGVAVPLIVVGALVGAYLWKKRAENAQTKQRNAAEVNALRDRGATLEMVPNPMWEQQPPIVNGGASAAAGHDAAPSDVYYSEIADEPQLDADGYVVDGSNTGVPPTESAVYATYASSSEASAARPYAAPNNGQLYASSADAAPGAEARPYSVPFAPASAAATYAVPAERGGIAYASSAPLASAAYENSSMLVGSTPQESSGRRGGRAGARSSNA